MMEDADVLAAIDEAFGPVPKPDHFTNFTHCLECAEHDELLRSRDRETLVIEDVGNVCWSPLAFSSTEGIAYYMPSLVRLSLAEPTYAYGWFGDVLLSQLVYKGADNRLFNYCTDLQKRAIALFLKHLLATRMEQAEVLSSKEEFVHACELWSSSAVERSRSG